MKKATLSRHFFVVFFFSTALPTPPFHSTALVKNSSSSPFVVKISRGVAENQLSGHKYSSKNSIYLQLIIVYRPASTSQLTWEYFLAEGKEYPSHSLILKAAKNRTFFFFHKNSCKSKERRSCDFFFSVFSSGKGSVGAADYNGGDKS